MRDEPRGRLAAHRAFHAALAAAAGNPLYELITSPLYAIGDEGRLDGCAHEALWQHLDAEHREILRCVVDRDVTGAQRATTWPLARLRSTWPRRPRQRTAPETLGVAGAGTGGGPAVPDGPPACVERRSVSSVSVAS